MLWYAWPSEKIDWNRKRRGTLKWMWMWRVVSAVCCVLALLDTTSHQTLLSSDGVRIPVYIAGLFPVGLVVILAGGAVAAFILLVQWLGPAAGIVIGLFLICLIIGNWENIKKKLKGKK